MLKETLLSSFKNKIAALVLKKDLDQVSQKMDHSDCGGSVISDVDA